MADKTCSETMTLETGEVLHCANPDPNHTDPTHEDANGHAWFNDRSFGA